MTENILVSPLGRSPGAVSGVAFALQEAGYDISRVITVGTSHPDVEAAAQCLSNLFVDEFVYDPHHIPLPELRDRDGSADAFVANMGLVLEEANKGGGKVHVAVTGGRSGMGALAALATNLYGADILWHFWVTDKIADGGVIDKLQHPLTKENMFLNPTVSDPEYYELVELPFIDMRPLHPLIWHWYRENKVPDTKNPYYVFLTSETLDSLSDVFPAGLTIGQVDRIVEMAQEYQSLSAEEQAARFEELLQIMANAAIIEESDKKRLKLMVLGNAPLEEVLGTLSRTSSDKTGFITWLNDYVTQNNDKIALTLTFLSLMAEGAQLWLQVQAM